ncbi:MAG: preprotein translocase subunit SecE [Candidatus Eremiobacteraeota bacterium]|nr:preprotein translocase subunit SecE [Candidatus Eremiobacteraeota bacterium]
MKRTIAPGDKVAENDEKHKRDRATEARDEDRERRVRAFQAGFRAIASEMKRVTWPSRDEWVSATLVTVGLVVVVALWTTGVGWLAGLVLGTGK